MIHSKKLICLLLISLSVLTAFAQKGYYITVKIPALKDSSLILGHYYGKVVFYPDDTVKLNKKGEGTFKGSLPLTGGMYAIFLPDKRYFEIFIGEKQNFTVEADTGNLVKSLKFTGSEENRLFYEYREFISSKNQQKTQIEEEKKKSPAIKDSLIRMMNLLTMEVSAHINQMIKAHPNLFFSTWLKTFQEVDIPDYPRDSNGNVVDSSFRYRYWRTHFFDHFDPADARLLRTPFYEERLIYFLEKMIPQFPDTINTEIDQLMNKVRKSPELYRYMLETLFTYYANNQIMGMDAVVVHLAENYYLKNTPSWVKKDRLERMSKEISKIKPNLLGKAAPDIPLIVVPSDHFMVARNDTAARSDLQIGRLVHLKDIKAKFLILTFWESDCGHCKKAMPLLYDSVYTSIRKKGAEVVAIHMMSNIEGKRKWVDFINEHGMYEWINATPSSFEFKDLYNVYTTPTIYVLDENKKIIAKKIGPEQIEEIIDFENRKRK